MQRIAVVGTSGSGKSTLARELASRLGSDAVDLDHLFHGPDWSEPPLAEFRARVIDALSGSAWVVAGNYTRVADLIQGNADTIVWLDLPRVLVTWRVIKRSVRRVVGREELWNGNRERFRNLINRDPERNIVLWAWQTHPKNTMRFEAFASGTFWAHADVHRLRSRREVRAFVEGVGRR